MSECAHTTLVRFDPAVESAFRHALKNFSPGYFALVMGTGMVSIGLNSVGFTSLSVAMLKNPVGVLWNTWK